MPSTHTQQSLPLSSQRVLLFAAPDFEDAELVVPYYRMLEADAEVKVAGLGDRIYKGKHGYPMPTDGTAEDFVVGHWDMVIIPGGWAPDKLRMNEAVLTIVRHAVDRGCPVGAICHGGWVLASANVIKGRRVTGYRAIRDDMVNAGGLWEDSEVVVDGPMITSRTPADLPAFCRALLASATARTAAQPTKRQLV
ncbi:MAG: type 1 glutamine amidotransferase [Vampirovibrionales bacterium]|nr:type 1 glutamine amidotransferase [Vampirovibrionales bacterium]